MTTSLTHKATYLLHESGTKFYEVVQLYNADERKFVLVKRWGKVAARVRGGEIKVEEYQSALKLDAAAAKVVRDKESRGYAQTKPDTAGALHNRNGSYTSEKEFAGTVNMHYGPNGSRVESAILGHAHGASASSDDDDEDSSDVVVEEPQPEPDRGETWGSW